MDYITTYFRDDKVLPFNEFEKMFKEDLEKENENSTWDITGAVYSDWGNGRDCYLNGHEYKVRTDIFYDSAKELFDDLMCDGQYDVILDVLKEMTEEEIFNIVSRIKRVNTKDGRLLLLES